MGGVENDHLGETSTFVLWDMLIELVASDRQLMESLERTIHERRWGRTWAYLSIIRRDLDRIERVSRHLDERDRLDPPTQM